MTGRLNPADPQFGERAAWRIVADVKRQTNRVEAVGHTPGGPSSGTTDMVYVAEDDPDVIVYVSTLPDDGTGVVKIPLSTLARSAVDDTDAVELPTLLH